MTTRVHLADDHTMFRQGLEAILSSSRGMEVVGRSSTGGEDAAAIVGENEPDVVVAAMDGDPNTAGEVLSRMRSASPGSRIVVLTTIETPRHLKALSRLGIDACVHRSSPSEDLIAAIDALGRAPRGDDAAVSVPRGLLDRMGGEPEGALSERETEVVVLAARGASNRRIGKELHISEGTVKRHLANVYEKMGVHSRTEAARKALLEQRIGVHEIVSANGSGGPHTRRVHGDAAT
jgi:DNA-binding NarL/FixJ family response regulator